MRSNKQSNIKVPKSGFKRSRFNWSHDVNTTFNWGEIQPTQCKLLIPGSKTTMSSQNLIRLAPMVAPTFGRVKYKTFNQFVGMSEIMPNFAAMMAQEPVTRNGSTFVPQEVPGILLGQLSTYVLFGAKATLYWVNPTKSQSAIDADLAAGRYTTSFRKPKSDGSAWVQDLLVSNILSAVTDSTNGCFVNASGIARQNTSILPDVPNVGSRLAIYPYNMINDAKQNGVWSGDGQHTPIKTDYQICLGASNYGQLIPVDKSIVADPNSSNPLIAAMTEFDTQVTMDGADYIVEFTVPFASAPDGVVHCAVAFELSEYGKRIRKVIQGCGYQIDFASATKVSILPLLAQYKAYFDVFGLQLFKGWETTTCARLIDYIKNNNVTWIDPNRYTTANQRMAVLPTSNASIANAYNFYFVNFMLGEVANEWYTENADFIGAHLPQLAVSPKADPYGFISVGANGDIDFGANINNFGHVQVGEVAENQYASTGGVDGTVLQYGVSEEGHYFIDQVRHGQVDAELLKRMYRWTNRNTILGREIAKILRAQGLGKFVDECKSNYIGATDDMITISDVTSLAATSEASLGEFGGKGIQYTESQTLVFENDEFGYWITLCTVVPEAGYTQGIDPTLKVLDKMNFYNPDFDALGMEVTEKDTVVGSSYLTQNTSVGYDALKKSFGFIPRYSKFKVCQNLVNGDFNRHNKRDIYLPYTLDKQINLNDFESTKFTYTQRTGEDPTDSSDWSTEAVWLKKSEKSTSLPIACNVYRMPTKYAWLGNFNRIFRDIPTTDGSQGDLPTVIEPSTGDFKALVGFDEFDEDNFMSHGIYNVQCYAPMKPINESYGLEDDDPDKAGAEFVQKA